MSEERISGIESRLGGVEVSLGKMETILERMEHQLLGNGQPGMLSTFDVRLKVVEQFRWQLAGGFALICGMMAVAEFVLHMRGGK